jgi:ABC-type molybdate transport system substrate-binding protein
MRHIASWFAVVAFVLGISSSAFAQTRVTLLVPDPLREEVREIVKHFEAKTGDIVQLSSSTGVSSRKTVGEGGALDVTLLFAPFDAALRSREANVDKSTQTVVARVRLAIAVKAGAPKPDISNAAAVRDASRCEVHRYRRSKAGERRWRGYAGFRKDGYPRSIEAEVCWFSLKWRGGVFR